MSYGYGQLDPSIFGPGYGQLDPSTFGPGYGQLNPSTFISGQTQGSAIGGSAIGGSAIGGSAIGGSAIGGSAIGGSAYGGTTIGATPVPASSLPPEYSPTNPGTPGIDTSTESWADYWGWSSGGNPVYVSNGGGLGYFADQPAANFSFVDDPVIVVGGPAYQGDGTMNIA